MANIKSTTTEDEKNRTPAQTIEAGTEENLGTERSDG